LKRHLTPLRFPGGKGWLLDYVERFILSNKIQPEVIIEPFAGSAAVSLGLLAANLVEKALINDIDPFIASFWKAIFEHNDELISRIQKIEVTLQNYKLFKQYMRENGRSLNEDNIVENALAFLFINRTSFSGIIKGGPLGGTAQRSRYKIDCRFNKADITNRIRWLRQFKGRIEVCNENGIDFLKKAVKHSLRRNLLFYVDPPYYNSGKYLYNYYFTDKEHVALADLLSKIEQPWLVSYDSSEFIKSLYHKKNIYSDTYIKIPRKSTISLGKKRVVELLFSNYSLPPLGRFELSLMSPYETH
jgi:DNA adenine methylase